VAFLMLGVGAFLWGISFAGVFPMYTVAGWFSSDGVLSASYVELIYSSQWQLSFSFLLVALLFGWIDARWILRFLQESPFWKIAGWAGGLALVLGYAVQEWLFDGIPHITDATSHLFQAKIFALGRMFVPVPECPDAFWQPNVLMTHAGKWFTKYTPGHALLLAGAIRLGLLHWILPLCGMGTVVMTGKLLEQFADRLTARLSMLLLATSPLLLLISGSYMSHISAMLFTLLGLFFWLRSRSASPGAGSRLWTASGGFFLAVSAMTRPPEVVLLGGMGLLFCLVWKKDEWKWVFRSIPWLFLGALPILGFWAFWNLVLYGNPLAIGYGFTTEGVLQPSYQGHLGFSGSFGFRGAVALLAENLDRANGSFWGWPISLLFVPFAFIRRGGRLLYLSAVGAAIVVGFYFFYNYRPELEARYYFLALPFFAYLTVRGMCNLVLLGKTPAWRTLASQCVFLLCGASYLYAALYYWPDYLIPKYRDAYENCSPELEREVRKNGISNAIMMTSPFHSFFYSSGFIHNDPLLDRDVLYARYDEDSIECLRRAFPERTFYRVDESGLRSESVLKIERLNEQDKNSVDGEGAVGSRLSREKVEL